MSNETLSDSASPARFTLAAIGDPDRRSAHDAGMFSLVVLIAGSCILLDWAYAGFIFAKRHEFPYKAKPIKVEIMSLLFQSVFVFAIPARKYAYLSCALEGMLLVLGCTGYGLSVLASLFRVYLNMARSTLFMTVLNIDDGLGSHMSPGGTGGHTPMASGALGKSLVRSGGSSLGASGASTPSAASAAAAVSNVSPSSVVVVDADARKRQLRKAEADHTRLLSAAGRLSMDRIPFWMRHYKQFVDDRKTIMFVISQAIGALLIGMTVSHFQNEPAPGIFSGDPEAWSIRTDDNCQYEWQKLMQFSLVAASGVGFFGLLFLLRREKLVIDATGSYRETFCMWAATFAGITLHLIISSLVKDDAAVTAILIFLGELLPLMLRVGISLEVYIRSQRMMNAELYDEIGPSVSASSSSSSAGPSDVVVAIELPSVDGDSTSRVLKKSASVSEEIVLSKNKRATSTEEDDEEDSHKPGGNKKPPPPKIAESSDFLKALIRDKRLSEHLKSFHEHLSREYALENLTFLIDMRIIEEEANLATLNDPKKVDAMCRAIISKYLSEDSLSAINLPDHIFQQLKPITLQKSQLTAESFYAACMPAVADIERMLFMDTFKRWVRQRMAKLAPAHRHA